jgi:hypothetical protein
MQIAFWTRRAPKRVKNRKSDSESILHLMKSTMLCACIRELPAEQGEELSDERAAGNWLRFCNWAVENIGMITRTHFEAL